MDFSTVSAARKLSILNWRIHFNGATQFLTVLKKIVLNCNNYLCPFLLAIGKADVRIWAGYGNIEGLQVFAYSDEVMYFLYRDIYRTAKSMN